jgi:hypothetical protein
MATKVIGCVDHDRGHITKLRVWADSVWNTQYRATVVAEIEAGMAYYTWFVNPSTGKPEKGARVFGVVINGMSYLRTDANKTPADNLGSLPDLAHCPF